MSEHTAEEDAPCRHCGKPPEADGDHSCSCPYPNDFCPDHPRPQDPWNLGPNQHTHGECRCGQWHGSDEFL